MLRYASFTGNSITSIKKSSHLIFAKSPNGIVFSSANFASGSRKKGTPFGEEILRKNTKNSSESTNVTSLLNPQIQKIVQYREKGSKSTPPLPPQPCSPVNPTQPKPIYPSPCTLQASENDPCPPKTSQSEPCPPKTSQSNPWPPKASQSEPCPPKKGQSDPCPPKTSQSDPCPPSPCPPKPTPPSVCGPKTPPPPHLPPNPPSNLKNILIALLVGVASLGGLYYAGVFGGEETLKSQRSLKDEKKKTKSKIIRKPACKNDFPAKVPYLLIGGGTASFTAFRAIKSRDPKAKVLVISSENSLPYMRPPLSKEIWHQQTLPPADKLIFKQWNGQERSLFYEPSEFYLNMPELDSAPHGGVVVATGWVVSKVDPCANKVEIEDPETNSHFTIEYEKCLIATGSRPKSLPVFQDAPDSVKERVLTYRNIQDLETLWQRLENVNSVAIVGGGFLGSELACSLARKFKNGHNTKVHQVFKESGNMGHVLPEYLAEWTTGRVVEEGVNVVPGVEVKDAMLNKNQVVLSLSNGNAINADVVIVAVGSEANTHLAEPSGLEVDPTLGGFLVNAELEARTNLYVAGDAACFFDPVLGRRRVEHHDHAVVSGRLAGENMVGAAKSYKHQSMFWSDLGPEVGYEAIGVVNSCLPTVAVFAKGITEHQNTSRIDDGLAINLEENQKKNENCEVKTVENVTPAPPAEDSKSNTCKDESDKEYNKGIVFYLKNEMIVGIVLWNVFNRMHIARQILNERRKYEDLNEVAKLFDLHDN